jgi:hypothetical protein
MKHRVSGAGALHLLLHLSACHEPVNVNVHYLEVSMLLLHPLKAFKNALKRVASPLHVKCVQALEIVSGRNTSDTRRKRNEVSVLCHPFRTTVFSPT